MEDMDFGRISIDETTTTSSDKSTDKSIDAAPLETGRSYGMMDVERRRKVDSIEGPPLAKIKESLDSLHSALEGQNQFGIYQIDDDTLSELEQQVNFVDIPYNIPTLKDRYPIPNPDSFTQNYGATVGSRRGRAKFRLNQAFTRNCKMATDLNGKIYIIYSEQMRKFDALSEHIKRLDGSGKRLIPSTIDIDNAEKRAEVEKTSEIRSRPIILDSPNPESETPREKEQSNTEGVAIDLEEEEEELEEDVEIDRQDGTNVDRPTKYNSSANDRFKTSISLTVLLLHPPPIQPILSHPSPDSTNLLHP
ncbi:hypothetical protein DY000_02048699 [Brassica cretica]|uniref:Uncharacterized protein n=1 Tax=Brassica cretica TaxID=69181 RepID=A0ABQ7F874_BRACR|nr:hypothetical protein DY000_02048699 [Brassica cretica]